MWHAILNKAHRQLTLWLASPLPKARRIALERRLRGKEEYRKLRAADAVIVSFGKSGRTWVRVMLSRFYTFRHGLPASRMIGFDNLHRKNPAIPKLFFTHDNYLRDFTGHRDSKEDFRDRKVVLLVRDPFDTTVSQFFQWKNRMRPGKKALNEYPEHGSEVPLAAFMDDEKSGLDKTVDFLNGWAREIGLIRDLLVVRYEDLRADTAGTLARIVTFLGTPGTPEEIGEAVRFASIENMRAMETRRTMWLAGSRLIAKDRSNPDSFKVRRAKVGGWRDYFTEEETARFEARVEARLLPGFGYTAAEHSVAGSTPSASGGLP